MKVNPMANYCFLRPLYVLFLLFLSVQVVHAQDIESARSISDAICMFIFLAEFSVGAIAALVILMMGLKYLSSGSDSGERYIARAGIIGAFVGILIAILAVPAVNIIASNLTGTVDCGYLPVYPGGRASAAGDATPEGGSGPAAPPEKSADIVAKGFVLTKSLDSLKAAGLVEFPLFFQVSNAGTQSSPDFANTVTMVSGMDVLTVCNVQAAGLPADGKVLAYSCTPANMPGVRRLLTGGAGVSLILKADSGDSVIDSDRDNNEYSQDASSVPVTQVGAGELGDVGGIDINYIRENP
jgi:hypothetical protein